MRLDGQYGGDGFPPPLQTPASAFDCVMDTNRLSRIAGRSMAEWAQQGGKLNVFISYSRDDLAFGVKTCDTFREPLFF